MAPKERIVFECTKCGYQSLQWLGSCPKCKEWDSFAEIVETTGTPDTGSGTLTSSRAMGTRPIARKMNEIPTDKMVRIGTHINELDRVLGGGVIEGMVILVGGNPGIGKSTLMSQMAALSELPTLYVSSEETASQMKIRIDRLGLQKSAFHVLNTAELEQIILTLKNLQSRMVVIDSIQMLHSVNYGNSPGSVTQLRICCQTLIDWARATGAVLFLVAHVTKEGSISGPKLIEHLVDTVLYFDDAEEQVRFLRASKNRFGNLQELGIFTLEERGLVPLTDPSSILRSAHTEKSKVGVVVVPVYEGSRVLLIEIQALTIPSLNSNARVYSDIIDPRRISRIAAVLERHVSTPLAGQDIYLNIAGRIRVHEVAIDLGIAHALYSAATNTKPPARTAVCGEVSLAGEVRPVSHMDRRVRTAHELGYTTVIGPRAAQSPSKTPHTPEHTAWVACDSVQESLRHFT